MLNVEIRSLTRGLKPAVFAMFFLLTGAFPVFSSGPPPVITAQPLDKTVLLNDTVEFSVQVSSATALSFQWRKNGINISGATQSTFTINSAKTTDAGKYSVRIVNGGGTVTSAEATLTVLTPPSISNFSKNQVVSRGENTFFSVTASGAAPLFYQWQFNGQTLHGATNSTLNLNNVTAERVGNYSVVITNYLGATTSSIAALTLQSIVARNSGPNDENDYLEAMVVDEAGNIYVTGYIKGETSDHDFATLKFDPEGNLLWRAIYNGPKNKKDEARFIALDNAGNLYVAGSSEGDDKWDYALVKYDLNGNELWVARYNGTAGEEDFLTGMKVDFDGNAIVTGASKGTGKRYNYVTIKYNSNGTQAWLQRYAGGLLTTEELATSLALDASGNVYVTGKSKGLLSGYDYATVKYQKNGNEAWVAIFSGDLLKDDIPVKVVTDTNGNVYVTGTSASLLGSVDYATIKYNSNGARQWIATYNGPNNRIDSPSDIIVDKAGNVFVTGSSEVTAGKSDYATIKYSSSGQQLWAQRYGTASGNDEANALALDLSGNVFVTGRSDGSGTGADIVTVKYLSANGTEAWVGRFNGINDKPDKGTTIAIDHHYNVYVGGQAYDKLDYTLLKYESGPYPLSPLTTLNNQSVTPGQDVTISVRVSGSSPLGYQWLHNGIPVPGATNAILKLNGISKAFAGSYSVIISNAISELLVGPASISLANVLDVAGAESLNSDGFSFQVSLVPGSIYVMQCSTNGTDWFPIATNVAANAEFVFTDPDAGTSGFRLYRMVVQEVTNAVPSVLQTLTDSR